MSFVKGINVLKIESVRWEDEATAWEEQTSSNLRPFKSLQCSDSATIAKKLLEFIGRGDDILVH